jgi:hypothetical protein
MFIEKVIHGYQVTLDTDMDGAGDDSPERVSGCWLNAGNDDGLRGSLEFALSLGGLENWEGELFPIDPQTLAKIESWAIAHGY